jgi:putative endonuclease
VSRTDGFLVERQAEQFLLNQGLQPVGRNFATAAGELDLIMLDGQTLVFIEVRYRRRPQFGSAAESVDRRKQQRICQAAARFLQQRPKFQQHPCRFDVIACRPDNSASTPAIDWIKQAFDAF